MLALMRAALTTLPHGRWHYSGQSVSEREREREREITSPDRKPKSNSEVKLRLF
jgi:hypothetical protein